MEWDGFFGYLPERAFYYRPTIPGRFQNGPEKAD